MNLATMAMADIHTHPKLQMRADDWDASHVDYLYDALQDNNDLPRIELACVDGVYYITDGHYTYAAYKKAKRQTIPVQWVAVTWFEAVVMAAGANSEHTGKKRTNADKRKAVATLLDELHNHELRWSLERISKATSVSKSTVQRCLEIWERSHKENEIPVQRNEKGSFAIPDVPILSQSSHTKQPETKSSVVKNTVENTTEQVSDEEPVRDGVPASLKKILTSSGRVVSQPPKATAAPSVKAPVAADWKGMETKVGELMRKLDECQKITPNTLAHRSCRTLLDEFLVTLKKWSGS